MNDPIFRFINNVRALIRVSIANKYGKKAKKTVEILCCTFEEFKIHMENQFDEFMTWDNYASYWQIDHIKPLALAKTIDDVIALNHYTNLQPLEKSANRIKSDYWEGKRISK